MRHLIALKSLKHIILWCLIAKARVLSDVAVYIPSLSEAAHAAHDAVRDADLARRQSEWEAADVSPWDTDDAYNGHAIAWSRRDPNLEAILADQEADEYLADLDRRLAEWDAANPAQRLDWQFEKLIQENLEA